ncbi:MAG: bifunctional YncE family protein/alkaline phosphatase family protein [Armatimonadetes bacterium]|nr:bifunctional YncE family protein/alkaline phosphatase family protein [Armatimonadota bacterium]
MPRLSTILALGPIFFVTPGAVAGGDRLPTGPRLRPAGRQAVLGGTLPLGLAVAPGGRDLIVTCGGALQGLATVDARAGVERAWRPFQTPNPSPGGDFGYVPTGGAFQGLALSPKGREVYAAGGATDQVYVFRLGGSGALTPQGTLPDPAAPGGRSFPAGLALNGPGTRLYAANNLSDTLAVLDVPGHRRLGLIPVGGYPLAVAAQADGSKVYVSSERDGVVSVVDPHRMKMLRDIVTGAHPDALRLTRDGRRLFVANADSDTVSIVDTRTDRVHRTILLRPAGRAALPGVTPTGLALAPDERTLYVTLADLNAVAVLALDGPRDDARLRGYVPTGWYPTAAEMLPDGRTLCVADGKGAAARLPNPQGPGPTRRGDPARYVEDILRGSVSLIPLPDARALARQTRQVLADGGASAPLDPDAARVAIQVSALPIKHVLYIIKENRTYDQVLGDLPRGNGDSSLALFGRDVTPNQHALAARFVLLDNFYDCAEVSADGWNWSTAGFANEYVQRTVPEQYSERKGTPRPRARPYDYEGENRDAPVSLLGVPDVAESPGGYLWDAVARGGLSLRNYGCFLTLPGLPDKPILAGHTCPDFAGFDLNLPDSDAYGPGRGVSRFAAWEREFDRYVQNGGLPAFEIIRLPRDHTAGTTPGMDSPRAMAADNDYAVGEIAQAVSHSPYWRNTAIFVVEDDAQNGPDHVDCHRSTAYVISPYTRRRSVDRHFYNTDSLLRTMELLLHLPPMTRYDALAPPLRVFTSAPDLTPFDALPPDPAILAEKNTRRSYGASRSRRMDFAHADAAPDDELNEILWHSIKGAHVPMPAIRQ